MSKSPSPKERSSEGSPDPSQICDRFRATLHDRMHAMVLKAVYDMFAEEVDRLCGPAYRRHADSSAHRAGSSPGSVLIDGRRVPVKKPRVKRNGKEVTLRSYEMLQSEELLYSNVMGAMLSGVSTRDFNTIHKPLPGGRELSKSKVSQAFIKASEASYQELNSRDFSEHNFTAIMIDAIHFSQRAVICALGITSDGQKRVLGLREGSSENYEVTKDLLSSLIERGLSTAQTMLFIIDGGQALRKGIRVCFGHDTPVQRCAVHKERNILSYLPKAHHSELRRRWKLLHGSVEYADALGSYESLEKWLSKINAAAAQSLVESNKETLTLIKLGVPRPLHTCLASTNAIESCYSMVSRSCRNVKNWNKGTDQATRWTAAALLRAEKKFRRIMGYKELGVLIEAIKGDNGS